MKIINKVWGKEEIICNNELYAGKYLKLDKGYMCSKHMHRIKDETFFVVKGKVLLEVGNGCCPEKLTMVEGDNKRIKPKTYHRFSGLKNSIILEISTHDDHDDSYRLTKSGRMKK